jgi:hypothetical protein
MCPSTSEHTVRLAIQNNDLLPNLRLAIFSANFLYQIFCEASPRKQGGEIFKKKESEAYMERSTNTIPGISTKSVILPS